MIVRIRQTSVSMKPKYDIESDGFLFQGERGGLHDAQRITMTGGGVTLTGSFRVPSLRRTRVFELERNGATIGQVARLTEGWAKTCYVIKLLNGAELRCYSRCKGGFDYVAVYEDGKQIALLENYLRSVEGRHEHKLYLLDEHREHAEVLAWFAMYYAQHEVQDTGDVTFSISFSRYNRMVDPAWRETHFPEENFFGKVNRFG